MSDTAAPGARKVFYLLIAVATLFLIAAFLRPLLWAAVLCIATWPAFEVLQRRMGSRTASALATLLVVAVVAVPLALAGVFLVEELRQAARFLHAMNSEGWSAPAWLGKVPGVGATLSQAWDEQLGHPDGIAELLRGLSGDSLGSLSDVARSVGGNVLHRFSVLLFALLTLFFLYLHGASVRGQLDHLGERLFGLRWPRYARAVPQAIRATVNGMVLLAIAEGVLLGIAYAIAGAPSPTILGTVTGVLALIPFGAPVPYTGVALFLYMQGRTAAAIGVFAWGTLLLFVIDHFIRPRLIGGKIRMPFLLVLLAILGGIESMGVVGIFVGPAIMALAMTVWRELTDEQSQPLPEPPGVVVAELRRNPTDLS